MSTRETPMLRRVVTFVAAEIEIFAPGSTEPFLNDYAKMLTRDTPEAQIVVNLLSLVVMLAEQKEVADALNTLLTKLSRPA